jgi:hypothetical protein
MNIIPNWRDAWRWFSVQALAAIVALPFVWIALPADAKAYLPDSLEPWVLAVLATGGLVGRMIDQQGKAPEA